MADQTALDTPESQVASRAPSQERPVLQLVGEANRAQQTAEDAVVAKLLETFPIDEVTAALLVNPSTGAAEALRFAAEWAEQQARPVILALDKPAERQGMAVQQAVEAIE